MLARLGETLANAQHISKFAAQQKNKLNGDLANQLNTYRLAESLAPLSPKQKAWASCCAFNQNNSSLETDPELLDVAKLLARDFMIKFKSKKSNKEIKKTKKPSPKRQGQPKPKKPTQKKAKQN